MPGKSRAEITDLSIDSDLQAQSITYPLLMSDMPILY